MCKVSKIAGLLHDAHEALTGDMATPVKAAMEEFATGSWLRFESMVAGKVRKALGTPARLTQEVCEADKHALEMEVYYCCSKAAEYMARGVEPQPHKDLLEWTGVWDRDTARREFLIEAKLLGIY